MSFWIYLVKNFMERYLLGDFIQISHENKFNFINAVIYYGNFLMDDYDKFNIICMRYYNFYITLDNGCYGE